MPRPILAPLQLEGELFSLDIPSHRTGGWAEIFGSPQCLVAEWNVLSVVSQSAIEPYAASTAAVSALLPDYARSGHDAAPRGCWRTYRAARYGTARARSITVRLNCAKLRRPEEPASTTVVTPVRKANVSGKMLRSRPASIPRCRR